MGQEVQGHRNLIFLRDANGRARLGPMQEAGAPPVPTFPFEGMRVPLVLSPSWRPQLDSGHPQGPEGAVVLPFPAGRSCRKMKVTKKLGRVASPRCGLDIPTGDR